MELQRTHHLFAAVDAFDGGGYVWMLLEMLLVLAIVGLVAWLVLRGLSVRRLGGTGPIRILAQQSIEPRRSLYLVGVGEKVLLVGSSESGLSTLAELTPDDVDGLDLEPSTDAPSSFASRLAANLGVRQQQRNEDPGSETPS